MLAPLDGVMGPIVDSVKKTGRLLTADEGSYSFCNGAEIVAASCGSRPRREDQTPGVPRRPGPRAPEMINYMKVDAAKIAAAARALVGR